MKKKKKKPELEPENPDLRFPEEIYVSKSFLMDGELEAYEDYTNAEHGATIAVYGLKRVCRVKVETNTYLVSNNDTIFKDDGTEI